MYESLPSQKSNTKNTKTKNGQISMEKPAFSKLNHVSWGIYGPQVKHFEPRRRRRRRRHAAAGVHGHGSDPQGCKQGKIPMTYLMWWIWDVTCIKPYGKYEN